MTRLWPSVFGMAQVVEPATILRWALGRGSGVIGAGNHESGQGGRGLIATLRDLIRRMSRENPLWGAPRIHGELLKLGFKLAKSTACRIGMDRPYSPPPNGYSEPAGAQGTRGEAHAMPSKADTAVARTIGIDTGKNTLHMIGLDEKRRGQWCLREKVSRTRIATRLANVPPCLIGIEAGMASHHVARELVALGHEVEQLPPAYSKPFRQGRKNDFRDAHAVAEAADARQRGAFR